MHVQVAEEVFLLSRTVRTFGTEQPEQERYQRRLGILRHISIRQAAAYLLYLTSNSFLFNLTKVRFTETWYGQELQHVTHTPSVQPDILYSHVCYTIIPSQAYM